ncbi:MAG TPA: choice-of-anchor L domain-containing protein, partial [Candidatus Nanopelagicales bacterium]|nr:choice-of-anchor L domain-containing protein [Candidatus Nanopelagicales bacterium]
RFDLNFYTYEFPNYICSTFNDFFVAMLTPQLANMPDGNISFDSQGNTISVNAGFLQVCHAQTASNGAYFDCPLGPGQLAGTGFDDFSNSAATAWLKTTAPIEAPGGEITLHFAVWDSGDGILDSTVLLDNFAFEAVETPTETQPLPPPE